MTGTCKENNSHALNGFKGTKAYRYFETFLHYRRPILGKFLKEVPRGSLILDLGCGSGGWSRYLESDLGFRVIGIDISKRSVDEANENKHKLGLRCEYIIGDARKLPFKDGSFDGIFSSDVLGHIVEVEQVIEETSRVLRVGGIASIYAETDGYVGKNTYQNYVINIAGEDPWVWLDGHIGLRSYKELSDLIEESDLEILNVKFFPYNHLLFALLYPLEYDYLPFTKKYPELRKSTFLWIVHLSAVLRKKSFICKVACHVLLKIFGTIFIYFNTDTDYGGAFLKLQKSKRHLPAGNR